MKTLIDLNNLTFGHDSNILLSDISVSIMAGDRIGLVGDNGSGKSTLLSILNKTLTPQKGDVIYRRGLKVESVEQFLPEYLLDKSIIEAVSEKLDDPISNIHIAQKLLLDLHFTEDQFDILIGGLSGGQKNRLMMARAFITKPDVVFFDEPTNHLDLKNLVFFEEILKNQCQFTFVIISHDRSILDTTTNRTIFVRDKNVYHFEGGYSTALVNLQKEDQLRKLRLEKEQKEIDRIKASAKRLAIWGKVYDNEDLSRKAKSMEKRVDKLEVTKTQLDKTSSLTLSLDTKEQKSKMAVEIKNFDVNVPGHPDKKLFSIEKLYLKQGEKVALLGENGVGKTTLITILSKAIRAEEEFGEIRIAPNTFLGLYDQQQQELEVKNTIWEELRSKLDCVDNEIKMNLIRAGFAIDRHHDKIGNLSGGERARIVFIILSTLRPNFMILDEPTNHLDIKGKEELEHILKGSSATLIVTGHDRAFIDSVASRFLVVKNGKLYEESSPNYFYDSFLNSEEIQSNMAATASAATKEFIQGSEEDLLEKLLVLEKKLGDDLARRPKFQKIKLQSNWREEIKAIKKELKL
ncbi:MAG: ABC-F family ATP-binding cassette domain-containing protein [Bacteriovoracaceae bacterium]|nr:ABC-F family ATP-binding cassette domain-containing protein [Bacteriovoracaceae bacterium]